MTLDTTVRYNAALRTGERDLRLVSSPAVDEGNWLFDKNDMVLSRFDLYSELDLTWRQERGPARERRGLGRHQLPEPEPQRPALRRRAELPEQRRSRPTSTASTRGRRASSWTRSCGATLELGGTSLNVKAGRFVWLPGEFLFGNGGSFTYSMAPNDGRKSDLSPGSSAKETALPIGQVSAIWQINSQFSVMGQVTAEFRSRASPKAAPTGPSATPRWKARRSSPTRRCRAASRSRARRVTWRWA